MHSLGTTMASLLRPQPSRSSESIWLGSVFPFRLRLDRPLGIDESTLEAEFLEGSLPQFVRAAWPVLEPGTPFLSNWHIDAVSEYLEAVTAGQITRLLVNMPPRYGKSILITIMWPVWEWIRRPETRWLFASYSGSLSVKHSVDRRTVIRSDWYQERWGHRYRL